LGLYGGQASIIVWLPATLAVKPPRNVRSTVLQRLGKIGSIVADAVRGWYRNSASWSNRKMIFSVVCMRKITMTELAPRKIHPNARVSATSCVRNYRGAGKSRIGA